MNDKRLLGAAFALRLLGLRSTPETIAERTHSPVEEVERALERLRKEGLLKRKGGDFLLSSKGRESVRVVFIGGGFEVIHAGHLYTIEQARKRGDVLVAVVARDSTIRKNKGREPVATEAERVKLLSSLRQVDAAMLGAEGDIYDTLEKVRPDLVALGYDQRHAESEISREAARRGIRLEVVRLDTPYPRIKTSRLLAEL